MQLQALLPPTTQYFEEMELLGARCGIDVQHPFADRDLIDFLIALPHAVKLSTVHRKPLLRDGLADMLPKSVAERPDKTEFTAVIDARVDFDACYRWVRDSGVRLEDIDYGRLFRDAAKPVNDRLSLDASGERTRLSGRLPRMSELFPGCHGVAVAPDEPRPGARLAHASARRSRSTSSSSTRSSGRATPSSCGSSMSRRSSGFRQSPPRPGGSRRTPTGWETRSICPCGSITAGTS